LLLPQSGADFAIIFFFELPAFDGLFLRPIAARRQKKLIAPPTGGAKCRPFFSACRQIDFKKIATLFYLQRF
jgi:hypothetical protein